LAVLSVRDSQYKATLRRFRLLMIIFLSAAQAIAEIPPDDDAPPSFEVKERAPWKEQGAGLPSYPSESDLIPVEIDVPGSRLEAFLDKSALSVGDDNVVRYVLVLKSTSGADNVLFEGIRCEYKEYRTYALGTHDKRLDPGGGTACTPLTKLGVDRYRYQLYKNYFCDVPSKPFPKHKILEFIKHGQVDDDQ